MRAHQPTVVGHTYSPTGGGRGHPLDSYGIVLLLIILDYIALSTMTRFEWGQLIIAVLLGATLFFTLRTSQARPIWQVLAIAYLLASTVLTLIGIAAPEKNQVGQLTTIIGGLLLIATPFIILRRISTHAVVSSETVLGAICVYLLLGFSFAFIYLAIGFFGSTPFFEGQSQANTTANDFLFFSYTTLTTVGYGNLVPASNLGQTFAMLEALCGQIYLVIVVARLVSLWGQTRSALESRRVGESEGDSVTPDSDLSPSTDGDTRDKPHQ